MSRPILIAIAVFQLSIGSTSAGGKHFQSGCSDDKCATEVIQLPAQRIVVETTRPNVIVNESRGHHRHGRAVAPVAVQPFLATPMIAGPIMATVLAPQAVATQEVRSPAPNPLRAIHQLEEQTFEINRMRAIQEAEIRETSRALQRASESLNLGMKGLSGNGEPSSQAANETVTRLGALESQGTTLKGEIDSLATEIAKLKKLISYHDEAIKLQLQSEDASVTDSIKKLTERIENMEKLISIHDEILRKNQQQ
ncbi:MAG: hypothetical protein U1D30_24145 [Planctomycetota bacterium]